MELRYASGKGKEEVGKYLLWLFFSEEARPLHYSTVLIDHHLERKKKKAIRAAIERSCHSRSNFSAWTNVSGCRPNLASPFGIGQSLPSLSQFNFHRWFRLLVLPGLSFSSKQIQFWTKGRGVKRKYIYRRLKQNVPASFDRTKRDENDSLRDKRIADFLLR